MINKDRLLRLAALLRQDAANPNGAKFDLNAWGLTETKPALNCGTAACAVGVACLSGIFKSEGLDYRIIRGEFLNSIVPTFNGESEWEAVQEFFGLSSNEAIFLFSSGSFERSKRAGADGENFVATRIVAFVANDGSMDSGF